MPSLWLCMPWIARAVSRVGEKHITLAKVRKTKRAPKSSESGEAFGKMVSDGAYRWPRPSREARVQAMSLNENGTDADRGAIEASLRQLDENLLKLNARRTD